MCQSFRRDPVLLGDLAHLGDRSLPADPEVLEIPAVPVHRSFPKNRKSLKSLQSQTTRLSQKCQKSLSFPKCRKCRWIQKIQKCPMSRRSKI